MQHLSDWDQLRGRVRTYAGTEAPPAFLLGGIGTGNFSIGSRGQFRDWEIFNWPGKNNFLPFSFFAVRTRTADGTVRAAVLESEIQGPHHHRSHGYYNGELAGLPRFTASRMWSVYPFVHVELTSDDLPVSVVLEAFTPFVPGDEEASGIPGAVLRYHVRNLTDAPVEVSVAGSFANALGFQGYDVFGNLKLSGNVTNERRDGSSWQGLYYTSDDAPGTESFGTMAFATTEQDATFRATWLEGQWTDNAQDFWDDFIDDGHLDAHHEVEAVGSELDNFYDFSYLRLREKVGSIAVAKTLSPQGTESFEFALTWHIPHRPKGWVEVDDDLARHARGGYPTIRNHYAVVYPDAFAAMEDLIVRLPELEGRSRRFTEALYSSSLPDVLLEAVANNITVIRSHTCFWLEDGNFYGWEGIRDHVGCGLGNVNHVWNYAQTLAFLFPRLEQTMRRIEFRTEIGEDGALPFRSRLSLGEPRWQMVPAADGQLGAIVRACREWRISGDDGFLREVWPRVEQAMAHALEYWDKDGDLVPDGQQSVTYDIEFYGNLGMTATLMIAALRACEAMAAAVGEHDKAVRYAAQAETSSKNFDAQCWNGSYYEQRLDDVDAYRYQFGRGCHSDQLLGQFLADITGLGHLLPPEHVRTALQSIVRHNHVEHVRSVATVQRIYALNEEPGLVLCTWPEGGRPRFPFAYSDEVWTGVEHQVAASLIREGLLDEALAIETALRGRHDGTVRNPWSENEAGHHYTRSLASYALLTAYAGFSVDLPAGVVRFAPQGPDEFTTFWCHGQGWGTYRQTREDGELVAWIDVIEGTLGTDSPDTPASRVEINAAV